MQPLMKCGHKGVANDNNGNPCCPICYGTKESTEIEEDIPSIEGRIATCCYCKKEKPSSWNLPFFVYKGPGSKNVVCKHCHFIHQDNCPTRYKPNKWHPEGAIIPGCKAWEGKTYEPISTELDEYYCGCRGWD